MTRTNPIVAALQWACVGVLALLFAAAAAMTLFAVFVMPFHGVYEPAIGMAVVVPFGLVVWGVTALAKRRGW